MEYRITHSGTVYRWNNQTEVLTPWGWTLAVFMLGRSGWHLLEQMSEPVAVDPTWPA